MFRNKNKTGEKMPVKQKKATSRAKKNQSESDCRTTINEDDSATQGLPANAMEQLRQQKAKPEKQKKPTTSKTKDPVAAEKLRKQKVAKKKKALSDSNIRTTLGPQTNIDDSENLLELMRKQKIKK